MRKFLFVFAKTFFVLAIFVSPLLFGQVTETFSNTVSNNSYNGTVTTFTGDNGGTWSYLKARTDRTLNGKCLTISQITNTTPAATDGYVLSPTVTGGMGTLTFKYVRDFTSTGSRTIKVIVNGSQIGSDITVDVNSDVVQTYSAPINISGSVQLKLQTIGNQIKIDDISWDGYSGVTPSLSATPTTLSGFNYVAGSGPSAEQNFTVSGSNLTGNVVITPPTNYEISSTSGSGFGTSAITLTPTSGTLASTTIYARLAAGLSATTYSSNITVTTTSATTQNIAVSGTVTAGISAPVATAATNVADTSLTANWGTVAGATSYILNLYSQDVIAHWNFNDDNAIIDGGISLNSGKSVSTNAGTITYVDSTGNITEPRNPISTNWDSGSGSKYWLAEFSTIGYSGLYISSIQRSSNTGPKDFKLQYMVGSGGTWTDVTGATAITVGNNVTSGVLNYIPLPVECDNQAFVSLRWIMTSNNAVTGGTVASTGTSRIDNIFITTSKIYKENGTNVGNVTSYNATDLTPGALYSYTLKSTDGTNTSIFGNTITKFTTGSTWQNGSWNNLNLPTASTNVLIKDNYPGTGTDAAITANNITVNTNKTLNVNYTVTANGNVVNDGSIVVNDNANFIQATGSAYSGSGTFQLNKNTVSAANKYVFWSSPVQNQNVFSIYGTAGTPQYVMTYNSDTDYYNVQSNPTTAAAGIGYSVKVPATAAPVTFTGAPNNGNVSVTLDNTLNAYGNAWNLIGNPYPSNLNLVSLYNSGNNGIDSSIYFWDNSSPNTSQQQNATAWSVFNAGSGTWTSPQTGTTGISVKPGQGFIVKGTSISTTFTNAMRNADATSTFVNKNTNVVNDKYWLRLSTPVATQYDIAITYGGGGLNTFESFDSKMMSIGADAIYSYLAPEKLAIQGRDNFVNTDVVTLGNNFSTSGSYTISLVGKVGLFDAGQAIYLKDKLTGTYTDLQSSSYTFSTTALEQTDRFEIVYQPQSVLGTSELSVSDIQVYNNGEHFVVKAPKSITSIEVYDASGRLVKSLKPNSTEVIVDLQTKGVYLLKIKSTDKETIKKLIK